MNRKLSFGTTACTLMLLVQFSITSAYDDKYEEITQTDITKIMRDENLAVLVTRNEFGHFVFLRKNDFDHLYCFNIVRDSHGELMVKDKKVTQVWAGVSKKLTTEIGNFVNQNMKLGHDISESTKILTKAKWDWQGTVSTLSLVNMAGRCKKYPGIIILISATARTNMMNQWDIRDENKMEKDFELPKPPKLKLKRDPEDKRDQTVHSNVGAHESMLQRSSFAYTHL